MFAAWLASLQASAEASPLAASVGLVLLLTTKHALCIPGGTLLNAAAGALFGAAWASALCLLSATLGGAACYLLSRACGARLLARLPRGAEARIAALKRRVEEASLRGSLWRTLLGLRLVPVVPQWILTLAAPH